MSDDTYKPIPGENTQPTADSYVPAPPPTGDAGKTLLAGVLGGILSAAGYLVYTRLPDEQKERVHAQARSLIESRVNELRGRFNI
jgi:hypothetical protein